MLRHILLIYFIFLLFVCYQLCGQGCAAQSQQPAVAGDQNTITEFLKDDKIKIALKSKGTIELNGVTVNYIQSAFLVAVNNVMVALTEVNYTEKKENKINILAKHIKVNDENFGDGAIKDTNGKWNLELASTNQKKTNDKAVIKNFAVVIKEKNIYHITVSNDTFEDNGQPSTPANWHVRLIKGDVNSESSAGKIITWTNAVSVKYDGKKLEPQPILQPTELLPSDGFAFVTNKHKNIIFIMKGNAKDGGTSEKNITAIFQLDESGNKIELLNVDSTAGCYPTFFQWKEKIYKISTDDSKCSRQKMMVFNEDTNKFKDSEEPIARLLDFLKDKRNFTNAVIGRNNVLLFIQQKSLTEQGDVNLWMYDGTRVGFVGAILKNIKGPFYGSLLHTDKGLFALHAKYKTSEGENGTKENNTFSLTLLKDQLDKIKKFLNEWETNKETVSKLCDNIDKQKFICTKAPPSDSLVGFLHSTINDGSNEIIWKDEYCYSNVTPESGKAENATNGLTFSGVGKRAEWSMKNQQEEKVYNFITFGFTLVATVTIDNSGKRNSILGVTLTSTTNTNSSVGLWCNTDGKWGVSDRDGSALKLSGKECKQGNTYNVAFVLNENDKNLDIYVNGEKPTFLTTETITILSSESIEKFYFGARIESDESYVTVTNVLLYNRPFNNEEIENLKEYVRSVEVITPPDEAVDRNTAGGSSDEVTPPPIPTSTKEKGEDEKEAPSPSRTEDGGVGGGVRVFSLLLAVLCVSAPLLHL